MARWKSNTTKGDWELSPEEQSIRKRAETRYKVNYQRFAAEQLKIIERKERSQKLVPFVFNPCQMHLHDTLKRLDAVLERRYQRAKATAKPGQELPSRLKKVRVYKARRNGISTYFQGLGFWTCEFNAHRNMLVMSHQQDSARNIAQISRRFNTYFRPEESPFKGNFRRPFKMNPSRELIEWDPDWDSRIVVATAGGGAGAARSFTYHIVHISEEAHFPATSDEVAAAEAAGEGVADMYFESTANGMTGTFYEGWMNGAWLQDFEHAVDNDLPMPETWNGEIRFFWPWHKDPGYQAYCTENEKEFILNNLDDAEKSLVDAFKCTVEQLKWRRTKIRGECSKQTKVPDPVLYFNQEYPSTPEEGFISTGQSVFDQRKLNNMRNKALKVEPVWTGNMVKLVGNSRNYMRGIRTENEWQMVSTSKRDGRLHIWKMPESGAAYVMGVDAAEGKEHGDWSVISIWHRHDGVHAEKVAMYRNKTSPHELAEKAYFLWSMYNKGFVTPEKNFPGNATCMRLFELGCNQIYLSKNEEIMGAEPSSVNVGFRTTTQSKAHLISEAIVALRDDLITLHDVDSIDEWIRFQMVNGRAQAPDGTNDDIVMADLLALWGHFVAAPAIQMWKDPTNQKEVVKFLTQEDLDADLHKKIAELRKQGEREAIRDRRRKIMLARARSYGKLFTPKSVL